MREYETIFVLHPSTEEKEVEAEIQAVSDLITGGGGEVIEVERWGRRRLAYEIKKAHDGIYTVIHFKSGPQTPRDIERRFRLNEGLLRHMTILSEGPRPAPQGDGDDRGRDERSERDRGGADRSEREPTRSSAGSKQESTSVEKPSASGGASASGAPANPPTGGE